eukprot:TRINITY_DN8350_c0_g1_i1.p1 TRINITY_DN8350_c0_g1~~TRINITY_DN8350_c0_g1_i1.p1  ORF type:complete len:143 (+),score=34.85 TRINITY_DN8350_c0_g1_i1:54-431(+)
MLRLTPTLFSKPRTSFSVHQTAGRSFSQYSYSTDPEILKKQLLHRSRQRGTKENDLIIGSFAQKYVPKFSEQQMQSFSVLLEQQDPELFLWITGKEEVPSELSSDVMQLLKDHCISNRNSYFVVK